MIRNSYGNNNGLLLLMLVALVAIAGMFVYFMSNNQQTGTIEVKPPQVSIPEPAKPGAQ